MKNKIFLIYLLFFGLLFHHSYSQSNSSIAGIYNNWEINFQLRLEGDGTLEFYTATSYTPYFGIWRKSGNTITISIPDYVSNSLKFKYKKEGLYNDVGKLVWKKVIN